MKQTYFGKPLICFLLCCAAAAAPPACVKLPRRVTVAAPAENPATTEAAPDSPRLDLNRATREELERLPGVGPALAARIVEHRARHGPFRRAEHLLLVRGVSERRFRELRHLVKVE
ncbi:MAG: helix-hairpin-helix domain-containing protein [Acidobacteriota bacterium]|nr:helix-hairpin-helix domain-containing protein [Acidobacteriota bacterium]